MAENDNNIWVQCSCLKWRKLCVSDPSKVSQNWTCNMNPDEQYNACDKPEEPFEENDDDLFCNYVCGSLVRAKMAGYPWWPAVVAEDPDSVSGEFARCKLNNKEVTDYHVVFLGKATTRCWVKKDNIKPFDASQPASHDLATLKKRKNWNRKDLELAEAMGVEAQALSLSDRLEKHVWWMKSADSCAEESQPCTVNADEHSSRVTKSEKKRTSKFTNKGKKDSLAHSTAQHGDKLLYPTENMAESPEHFTEAFNIKSKPPKKSVKRPPKEKPPATDVSATSANKPSAEKKKVVKSLFKPVSRAEMLVTSELQNNSPKSPVIAASSNVSDNVDDCDPCTPLATELPAECNLGITLATELFTELPAVSPSTVNIQDNIPIDDSHCVPDIGKGNRSRNIDYIIDAVARGEFSQEQHADIAAAKDEPSFTAVVHDQESTSDVTKQHLSNAENNTASVAEDQSLMLTSTEHEAEQPSVVPTGEKVPVCNEIPAQDGVQLGTLDSVIDAVARGEFTVNLFTYLDEVEPMTVEASTLENVKSKPKKKAAPKSAKNKALAAVVPNSSDTAEVEMLPGTRIVADNFENVAEKTAAKKKDTKRKKPSDIETVSKMQPAIKKVKKFATVVKTSDNAHVAHSTSSSPIPQVTNASTIQTETKPSEDQTEIKEAVKEASVQPKSEAVAASKVKKFAVKKAFVRPAVVPSQCTEKDKVTPVQSSNDNSRDEQCGTSYNEEMRTDQSTPIVSASDFETENNVKLFPIGLMSAASAISNVNSTEHQVTKLRFPIGFMSASSVKNSDDAPFNKCPAFSNNEDEVFDEKRRFPIKFMSAALASNVDASLDHCPTSNAGSTSAHEVESIIAKPKFTLGFISAASVVSCEQAEQISDVQKLNSADTCQLLSNSKAKQAVTLVDTDEVITPDQAVEDGETLDAALCHGNDLDLHVELDSFNPTKTGDMLFPEIEHERSVQSSPLGFTVHTVDLNTDISAWN